MKRARSALLLLTMAFGCGNGGELCRAWATASCPASYPNLQQGVSQDACESNVSFSCGTASCDSEYEAKIRCEIANPNCCNATECNNAPLKSCSSERDAWTSCVDAVRASCS